jgi:hypothetical protein
MSCTALWREPPAQPPWGAQRRQREEELFDELGDERELLQQAEEAECRLMERVVAYQDAGRVVPDRLLEQLEKVRERIGWIELMVAEIQGEIGRR